jgi:DNA modification methylase
LTVWALRKGRAAIFADTGLGKTFMQVEWARIVCEHTGRPVLIVAPLSVARQTIREARKIAVNVHYTRSGEDLTGGINITNYEMIGHFDFAQFGAVVLDESSILKSLDGKTRQRLTDACASVPYRLCCTATPAPNDISEIANHAEFLGIMTRANMLAMYFVHDDDGYRLKGHARDPFFRWLASWGMSIRKPSDIGHPDDGYDLPPLEIEPHYVKTGYKPDGQLFFTGLDGISGRLDARRNTFEERVQAAAELVNSDSGNQWIVWCGLNDEQDALTRLISGCVSVYGHHSPDEKAQMIEDFQDGKHRVLITKAKIAGFGMNLQNATRQVFVGLSDSYEAYYQCIRRSWRFGQDQQVKVYIVLSEAEDEVYQNVKRKEAEALQMSEELISNVQQYEKSEISGRVESDWEYHTDTVNGSGWTAMLGDSCERMTELADESIDFSVYSPPFMSLYTYSPTERDLGNSASEDEFFEQYQFIIRDLLRVTKPGRITAVHVAQVPAMLSRDGYIGLKDFRGAVNRAYIEAGWIFHGEICIDKDPQAQAIRTKAKALLFTQMHKDSSWSRPALADYIQLFRKPGENAVPIQPDIDNNEWIEWARPIWYNIKESDTLQFTTAREEKDERHICPLQLGTIERCIRLWSNPGELVFSPFMGIGSEGHEAVRLGRRFAGIELKENYWRVAARNLREAETKKARLTLFDAAVNQGAFAPGD